MVLTNRHTAGIASTAIHAILTLNVNLLNQMLTTQITTMMEAPSEG